jgi:hypothetical protein
MGVGDLITLVLAMLGGAWWVVSSINRIGAKLDTTAALHDAKHAANEIDHKEFRGKLDDHGQRITGLETKAGLHVPRRPTA